MANLKTEYTDVKGGKRKVEHLVVSGKDNKSKERIVEELLIALTRPEKRIPA